MLSAFLRGRKSSATNSLLRTKSDNVPVSGDDTRLDHLSHAVHHPGLEKKTRSATRRERARLKGTHGSSSLGVTGEPLLSNDGAGVADSATEVAELLVVRVTLVLVVGDSRSAVELHGEQRQPNPHAFLKLEGSPKRLRYRRRSGPRQRARDEGAQRWGRIQRACRTCPSPPTPASWPRSRSTPGAPRCSRREASPTQIGRAHV